MRFLSASPLLPFRREGRRPPWASEPPTGARPGPRRRARKPKESKQTRARARAPGCRESESTGWLGAPGVRGKTSQALCWVGETYLHGFPAWANRVKPFFFGWGSKAVGHTDGQDRLRWFHPNGRGADFSVMRGFGGFDPRDPSKLVHPKFRLAKLTGYHGSIRGASETRQT